MLNAVKHLGAVRSGCAAAKHAQDRFVCEGRARRVVLALGSFRLRRQDDGDGGRVPGSKRQLPFPVMLNAVKHLGAARSGCAAAKHAQDRFVCAGRARPVMVALRSFRLGSVRMTRDGGAGAGLANLSAFPASHAERSEAYQRRTDGCLVGKACKGALCVPDVLRWRWHPS